MRSRRHRAGRLPMLLPPLLLACAVVAGAAPAPAPADTLLTLSETEFHLLEPAAAFAELAHPYVVPGTMTAAVDGTPWREDEDFRVDPTRGVWIPLRPLGAADGGPVVLRLTYRYRPAPVPPRRILHPVRGRPERSDGSERPATRTPSGGAPGTGDLLVRGSKSVRMSSGNRRDLTVDQTLRLSLAGWLTEDIHVDAALSDDNLPVVPEGNTEELRDIDRMRVELTAPRWRAVLGDFTAERSGSVYGGYRRKLQGVMADGGGGVVRAGGLAGSPRGTYRTLQIRGEESNQGPYFLGGGATGEPLFIVAGTERVTLDGIELVRGADRDYVVDYVRGTVTFTYRRLITAESEILVEFEEGEGPYVRTVAGGEARAAAEDLLPGGLDARLAVNLIRERDDPDRPRAGELSEADRASLEAAGDDPEAAVTDGLTPVEIGEGSYRLEDMAGVTVAVYDTVAGDYDVEFRYVGSGEGDYAVAELTALGERVYEYRGAGGGGHRIGRRLDRPVSHSLASLQARVGDETGAGLDLEWHASVRDENVLSSLDDADDAGRAWRAALDAGEHALAAGGRDLGRLSLRASHDDLGAGFRPFLLARDLFRYDRWGLGDRARREGFLEARDVETSADAAWTAGAEERRVSATVAWGRLEHGDDLRASRLDLQGDWRLGPLRGGSRYAEAAAEDDVDPLDVRRFARHHEIAVARGPVRPSAGYDDEEYADAAVAAAASAAGYRLRRWRGGLDSDPTAPLSWSLGFERGQADSLRAGGWRRERDTRTGRWRMGTPTAGGVRLQADGVIRDVEVPGGRDLVTRLAKVQLSGRWDATGSDWGLIYGVDNSRTEVLDRQVVYVGERAGDYNQNGDYVGRQLGDFDVVTVGTDSLVATTEVVADLTWRQDFGFLGRDRVWGGWTSFTRVSVKGRSRTDDAGRLLRLAESAVFDEQDTVLGEVSLRQEATLLRHLSTWDLRLVHEMDQALDRQYAAHPERRLRHRTQAALSWTPSARTSLRARSRLGDESRDTREEGLSANRSYAVDSWRHELEWSLQPGPGNRVAAAVDAQWREDAISGVVQREYGLKPSARWRLRERWSGLAELRWSTVDSDEPDGALRPYFFAEPGGNVEASARLNWEPSDLMTVSLVYFGRRLGERGWSHDVRMESTARF